MADVNLFPRPVVQNDEFGSIGIFLLDYVMLKSPNLESLVLQIPRYIVRAVTLRPVQHHPANWYLKMRTMIQQATQNGGRVLTKLKTVKLISETEDEPHFGIESSLRHYEPDLSYHGIIDLWPMTKIWMHCVGIDFCYWLNSLLALATAKGNILDFRVHGHLLADLSIPPSAEEVSLSGFYSSIYFEDADSLFPQVQHPQPPQHLRKLEIRAFPSSWGSGDTKLSNPEGITISDLDHADGVSSRMSDMYDQGLLLYSSTLRVLDLQTGGLACSMTAMQGPPMQGLRCLPSMSSLQQLTIEIGTLFVPIQQLKQARLETVLPPSLESLTLIERWHPHYTCGRLNCQEDCVPVFGDVPEYEGYPFWLLRAMSNWSIIFAGPKYQPRLRTVVLIHNRLWKTWSISLGRSWHPVSNGPPLLVRVPDVFRASFISPMCERRAKQLSDGPCEALSHRRLGRCVGPELTWGDVTNEFAERGVRFSMGVLERGKYYQTVLRD